MPKFLPLPKYAIIYKNYYVDLYLWGIYEDNSTTSGFYSIKIVWKISEFVILVVHLIALFILQHNDDNLLVNMIIFKWV